MIEFTDGYFGTSRDFDGREGWAKRARQLHVDNERLRAAVMEVWTYVRAQRPDDHRRMGEACGEDACVLCLAESVAWRALRGYDHEWRREEDVA